MTTTTALPYRIGPADAGCRYPVIVGTDLEIGRAYRWHRDWLVVTSQGETCLGRPPQGTRGVDMAAAHLAQEYAAGKITAAPLTEASTQGLAELGPVPLLHPRMPATARNQAGAHRAFAGLRAHRWTAHGGFPGSDNPWALSCDLCGWTGLRFWSHLRGRNGNPPSPTRHDGGCIGPDQVRALIPAYQQ